LPRCSGKVHIQSAPTSAKCVSQWPNLRHLAEQLGAVKLLEAVSFKEATESVC